MIKLKSLFRRGQGGPSSGSSKHSNQRSKSQSTTSLNSALENEQQQLQQQAALAGFGKTNAFYPTASERGVDVGDDQKSTPDGVVNSAAIQSQTLPHKKSKATTKKGHKQPKQLPASVNSNAPVLLTQQQQQQLHQNQQQQKQPLVIETGNVMTTLAATAAATSPNPKTEVSPPPTVKTTTVSNNNYAPISENDLNKFLNHQLTSKEIQQLLEIREKMHEEVERLECEKRLLEARVVELQPLQNDVARLKSELSKMQSLHEKSQMEIANLKYENDTLRNRLRDVVNSPLSDAEKHQLIQDTQRLHSSAPASIALPSSASENDGIGVAGTPSCLTPDWDKNSSSSEISVACLQDKIIQMEETHYSTNEELQATLQELADLQSQLSDAHTENERLAEEKDVLFQSLCRQTEKLNETRTQIASLQELLLRDAKQAEVSTSEREKKLLDLIKTAQEEREAILIKQEELNGELQELRQSMEVANQENTRYRERISLLDSTVDAANAERKQIESQLLQAKEDVSQRSIEIERLTMLLDNARSKIDELEQDLARGEKTDLTDLLDVARKEKDTLEGRVAELQDQCSRNQAEIRRLKDQLSGVTEECKVAKNNAKCAVSHLEYRLEQLQQEKDKVSAELQQLTESTAELQVQSKCHLEDKTQLQNLLSEAQKHLGEVERKLHKTEEQLEKEMELRKQDAEEWEQFQSDLLMTVRVANDFKTEALSAREQLVLDNKTQKERIRLLEQEIDKLTKQQMQQNETQQSVLSTVQQEMASRRNKIGTANLNRQDSRLSVKSLIETIENNKQSKSEENESHYSSTSSLNSGTPEISSNALTVVGGSNIATEWNENMRLSVVSSINSKGPLREQQQQTLVNNMHLNSLNNGSTKSLLSGERKDPLNMLAKNGGSKRNALLKWCQNKTVGYRNIDITNFSSSWNDGLAFCAILHSYLPDRIPYDTLTPANKRRNFSLAFAAAESVGITTTLNINDMCQLERPDWTQVMGYVTAIYKHFET